MMNKETIERIQLIKSEIYSFFESEIMWASMDEYLSSSELVALMNKLEERYGFAAEIEEAAVSTVQDDNVRRYLWVGIQKLEISGFKKLRHMADMIIAAIAEEAEIVNLESSYCKELMLYCLEWTGRDERPSTFSEMISAIAMDRFCDEAFAEILKNAGFILGKADYCGCKDTYYVVAQNGQKIWFEDVIVKNGDTPVKYRRQRIEVQHALADTKNSENDITKKP